jgi:hypothetical protein
MLGMLLILTSCEKSLDRDIITNLSEEQVTSSYDFTRSRLSAIYGDLPEGFTEIDGAMISSASDESEHTMETSSIQKFNTGAWNAYDNPDGLWNKYYQGIRKANLFLESADKVNLDAFKLDPAQQAVYENRLAEIKRWKYEARFLRAFFHAELVKRYAGVPIVTRVFSLEDDAQGIQRNTLAECIDFIAGECDSAAAVLPLTYGTTDLGRVTRGAALALKSRILLYAASDLFNNTSWAGGFAQPQLISMPAGDRSLRWKAAADAAKAVIDLAGTGYALHSGYAALFKTFNSSEIILTRRSGPANAFEKASYPIGYDLGQSGTTPSQNLVDAYEVKVSSTVSIPFDWNNPVHAANPYANRDPRLGFTVLLNNTTFKGRPVESWTGGLDGKGKEQATKTGYYLRKYVDESVNLLTNTTSVHSWILIRLPEIYLNYAEALNEYSPGHSDVKIYVDRIRARTGVAMPGIASSLSQADAREAIRRERRIEFAFEGHRIWDLRRWMQGPGYLDVPLKGVNIVKTGTNSFTYTPVQVEERTFQPKMYLYPIPQQELQKAKSLVQNPLW